VYCWQFTQSRQTSSLTTKNNCSFSSRTPSSTRRQSQLVRPGTLTWAELLGSPSRPLRWLSHSTPTTFQSSSQPSSSSQLGSKSRNGRKLTATRNELTAIDSDRPLPDPPGNTQLAPIAQFIILTQLTAARTPPAQKAATPKPSPAAAPPPPPTAPTAVTTTMPSPENPGLDQSRLLIPRPPPRSDKELSDASSNCEEGMDVGEDGRPAPCTPEAPSAQIIDLSTTRPLQDTRDAPAPPRGPQPAPTGQAPLPVTPSKPSGSSRK